MGLVVAVVFCGFLGTLNRKFSAMGRQGGLTLHQQSRSQQININKDHSERFENRSKDGQWGTLIRYNFIVLYYYFLC